MISINLEQSLKEIAELETKVIASGVLFLFVKDRTIIWKVASDKFDMDVFSAGTVIAENAISAQAIKSQKTVMTQVPRERYGKRLLTVAIPLVDEENKAVGAFSIVLPLLHPIAASFSDFAPIIAELFPEGAFLYMSDLTQIAYTQGSSKFTLSDMKVGYTLKETDIAYRVVHSEKPFSKEIGPERYGVPVYIACYPIFDKDENNRKILVASLGVVMPKGNADRIKHISDELTENLNVISDTVTQLAESATEVNENEMNLYQSVEVVNNILSDINKVTDFIFVVARQSNLLGLNAAIEASRLGEAGKGFAVVASEIRKLSEQSKQTVPKIQALTENIQSKITRVNDLCKINMDKSQNQAAGTEEISANVEELLTMAKKLNEMSRNL
jgi:uncharacterized protein YoxC